jgi:hypothetical protein
MAADNVPLWVSVLTAVGVGSFGAAVIAFLANRWVQLRQEHIEISKTKMGVISDMLPLYGQLASNYSSLSSQLMKMKDGVLPDIKLSFFLICNALVIKERLIQKYGGFVLDDLDAEIIINDFRVELELKLNDAKFDRFYRSRFAALGRQYKSYHQFRIKVENDPNAKLLYDNFARWLSQQIHLQQNRDQIIKLAKRSQWFSDLLTLEMNNIFNRWYGLEPSFESLDVDLRNYLSDKYTKEQVFINCDKTTQRVIGERYTNYYNRLVQLGRKREKKLRRRR